MKNFFLRQPQILVAVSVSLFLSLMLCLHGYFLNPDGVCYLSSAAAFHQSGLNTAMHVCSQASWPFYAFLIDIASQTTHSLYLNAAYILDAIFTALTVLFFLFIVKALGGGARVLWFAAFVILFSRSFEILRIEVIRDHGYWAFYLASLYAILHYFQRPSVRTAFLFGISIFVASLFRIEGVVFLVLLPFIALIMDQSCGNRLLNFITLNTFNLLLLLCLSIIIGLHPHIFYQQQAFGRLSEFYTQLQQGMALLHERYLLAKSVLQTNLLPVDGAHDASLLVIVVFLVWYLYGIISCLSIIYTGFFVYAWVKKINFDRVALKILIAYLCLNVLITLVFLGEHLFLSSRYILALVLILMLWVPFGLNQFLTGLLQRQIKMQKKWGLIFFGSLFSLVVSTVFALYHEVQTKMYLFHAGQWLRREIPLNASFYSNDNVLAYYAHRATPLILKSPRDSLSINKLLARQWSTYDFIAIRVQNVQRVATSKEDFLKLTQEMKIVPIKVFTNHHGDDIYIYKILQQPLLGEKS